MFNARGPEIRALASAALVLIVYKWAANAYPKQIHEEKYQGGESYANPSKIHTGLLADLKAMGCSRNIIASAQTVFDLAKGKRPVDDKTMLVRISPS